MRNIFNIIVVFCISFCVVSVSLAGDKPRGARDLPNLAGRAGASGDASSANEVSAPVDLITPESVIDKAVNSPIRISSGDEAEGKEKLSSEVKEKKNIAPKKKAVKHKKKRKKQAHKKYRSGNSAHNRR